MPGNIGKVRMALTSTLFTALSGLDVNQTRLNVVGNNIANVNTVAFKSSRALFKPQFYVTDIAGSPASDAFGGSNPSQRGLGATISTIEKDFSPGSIEPTGKPTDLAIDGEGFFVVQGNVQKYTRDGSFTLNSNNELVTQSGDFVQGFPADENFSIQYGAPTKLTIPLGTVTSAQATENVNLEGNLNASGAVASGASILTTQALTQVSDGAVASGASSLINVTDATGAPLFTDGETYTLAGKRGGRIVPERTFTVDTTKTVDDLLTFFGDGLGIDATVTAAGVTPGVSIDTTGKIVVTGNVGTENALAITSTGFVNEVGSAPFLFSDDPLSAPAGESVYTSLLVYDSLGTPLTVDVTAVLEAKADTGNTWRIYATSGDSTGDSSLVGNGTIVFDSEGQLISSNNDTITIRRDSTGAATPSQIKLDFSLITSLTDANSTMVQLSQDGSAIGTLNNFSIGESGELTGSFSNGLTRTIGQVALATFKNQRGLQDVGGNQFVSGASSGLAIIAPPLTLSGGGIRSGALELSNVDLSTEFINLIISSTGFSASSRVITTSDQLITELLNASR